MHLFLTILILAAIGGIPNEANASAGCENLFSFDSQIPTRVENVERLQLSTERLEMRPLTLDMAEEIYRMQQDAMVQRIASEKATTLPAIRKHIQNLRTSLKQIRTTAGTIDLAIVQEGKIVGNILAEHSYLKNGSQVLSVYVLGYQIDKPVRGQGVAGEAVERLTELLFKEGKADEIQAYVHVGNDASSKVLRKNGFEKFDYDKIMDGYVQTLQAWRRRNRDKT